MISSTSVEIIYADTDMMGVVYHGSYIAMFERGRNQYIRDAGFNLQLFDDYNIMFPVFKLEIDYKHPVKYYDLPIIKTSVIEFTKVKTIYLQQIYVNNKLCISAKIGIAHVDSKTFLPANLAKIMPEFYTKYLEVMKNE